MAPEISGDERQRQEHCAKLTKFSQPSGQHSESQDRRHRSTQQGSLKTKAGAGRTAEQLRALFLQRITNVFKSSSKGTLTSPFS